MIGNGAAAAALKDYELGMMDSSASVYNGLRTLSYYYSHHFSEIAAVTAVSILAVVCVTLSYFCLVEKAIAAVLRMVLNIVFSDRGNNVADEEADAHRNRVGWSRMHLYVKGLTLSPNVLAAMSYPPMLFEKFTVNHIGALVGLSWRFGGREAETCMTAFATTGPFPSRRVSYFKRFIPHLARIHATSHEFGSLKTTQEFGTGSTVSLWRWTVSTLSPLVFVT